MNKGNRKISVAHSAHELAMCQFHFYFIALSLRSAYPKNNENEVQWTGGKFLVAISQQKRHFSQLKQMNKDLATSLK